MIDVLVVEDDPRLLQLMTVALGLEPDLAVRGCTSAEIALDAVSESAPTIALLDLHLPGMGGREVAKRIAELAPAARIVFVTGKSGADLDHAVIQKPFDPLGLAAEVRRLAGAPEAR